MNEETQTPTGQKTPDAGTASRDQKARRAQQDEAFAKQEGIEDETTPRQSQKAADIIAYCSKNEDPGASQSKAFTRRARGLHSILSTRRLD